MKLLVTGGAGFIGSHVVDLAIEAGHQVAIVDNLWEHGGGRMENVNPLARFFKMDVRDPELAQVFAQERPDVVCHLAAQHSVKISTDMPEYDGKVVFSSSGATYGTVGKMPVDECTPQRPESPYGITKLASEHYLRYWKAMYDLDFTALRYGNVYGPRQDPTGEAGVIAIFAHAILTHNIVRIDWDGEQQKDYVYVRDVARANLLATTAGDGEAYCIATGTGTSVNALYEGLVGIIGHETEILRAPRRPGDIYLTYFDCRKAQEQLNWQAEVGLEEGLRYTVGFFQAQLNQP
jgi:UDP-glucose 4-epimerase